MPTLNDLNGHFSYRLFNEQLFDLYKIIENINYDNITEPDPSYNGALWRDGNDLKYAADNKWNLLYQNKFQLTDSLTSLNQPDSPICGQLWIDKGVIKYFDGTAFVTLKADTAQLQTTAFDYYNYLLIHSLKKYGDNFLTGALSSSYFSKIIYKNDWQATGTTNIYSYTIPQSEHQLKNNFAYLLTTDVDVGDNISYKHELDDTEFQITVDASNNIIIYVNILKDITVNLIGTQSSIVSGESVSNNTYLVPNAKIDRVFFDGIETDKHDYINDVTLTIKSDIANNKNISLAHVDPKYLSDIKKTIVVVSNDYPYVNIKTEVNNTYSEYYIYNYDQSQFVLLTKADGDADYIETPNGIMLTKSARNKYFSDTHTSNIVFVVTFCFKAFKTKGDVHILNGTISNTVDGIDINSDDVSYDNTFILIDNEYSSGYSIADNKLYINDYNDNHYVSLIKCVSKHHIVDINHNDDNLVIIDSSLIEDTANTLICFNKKLYRADSFENKDGNIIIEKNYNEIDYIDIININNIILSAGTVSDNTIPCIYEDINANEDFIVIIDNNAYSSDSIIRDKTTGSLYHQYIKNGANYIIIKNSNNAFIKNDYISSSFIKINKNDGILTYLNGSIVCDLNSINLSKSQYTNQVILSDDIYSVIDSNNECIAIDEYLVDIINDLSSVYTIDSNYISFNNNHVGSQYIIYNYTYGSIIEKPIIVGEIDGSAVSEDNICYLNGNDQYATGTNALSVYINGIKQYPGTFEEISSISFKINEHTDSIITYVIEPIENTETVSCRYCIVNKDNMLPAYDNTFITDSILSAGYITVFKNGVRLNSSEYDIKNSNTLYISNVSENDVFLIESRQDYSLRENTLPIQYDNIIWNVDIKYADEDSYLFLPDYFITSHDTILVYLNGLLLGGQDCYEIDKINNTIKLCDEAKALLNNNNKTNGYVTFEWR